MYVENGEEKYIEKCSECDNGVIHICPECGNVIGRSTYCTSEICRLKRESESEARRFEKANKYTLDNVPRESCEYFFSDSYGNDDGYFDDIDSLEDYCKDNDVEKPKIYLGNI